MSMISKYSLQDFLLISIVSVHRYRSRRCVCLGTGQNMSVHQGKVTSTTVALKSHSGRDPRNGWKRKFCQMSF